MTLRAEPTKGQFQVADTFGDKNYSSSDFSGHTVDGIQLVDGKHSKLYLVASDGDGDCLCSRGLSSVFLDGGEPLLLSATYAAPAGRRDRGRCAGAELRDHHQCARLLTGCPTARSAATSSDGTARRGMPGDDGSRLRPRPTPPTPLPVIDIVAPVLDIETGTADLKRRARVERQGKKITVTLDATILFGKDSARLNANGPRPARRGRERSAAGRSRLRQDHRVYRRPGQRSPWTDPQPRARHRRRGRLAEATAEQLCLHGQGQGRAGPGGAQHL